MSNKHFYENLMDYFIEFNIDAEVYYDTFTNEQYAAFGKEKLGVPRLFIDKDTNIGNVSVYGIEFHEPLTKEAACQFEQSILSLKHFLKQYHNEENTSYILYRRDKSLRNKQLGNTPNKDIVYKSFLKDHAPIEFKNHLYSLLAPATMHWCVHSGSKSNLFLNRVIEIAEHIKNLKEGLIGDTRMINNDILANGFRFHYKGEEYQITFTQEQYPYAELKMFKHQKSIPLMMNTEADIHIEAYINELKTTNKFYTLVYQKQNYRL